MASNATNLELYAQIQALVQKEAKEVATQVYTDMGTKYGVASVPFHRHNGADSPIISADGMDQFIALPATPNGIASPALLGTQVINDPTQASNVTLAGQFSTGTIYVNPIPIVYGTSNGLLVMSGNALANATSANLTTAYPYASGVRTTTFSNANSDTRAVTYTKGSTGISWTPGLTGNTTSTALGVGGSPYEFAGGDAPAGSMIIFSNPSNPNAPTIWFRINTIPGFSTGTYGLTGSLAVGATAATLSVAWAQISGTYWVKLSSGETRPTTFTKGSTAITFGALTATATSTITVSAVGWWGVALNQLLPAF